MLSYLQSWCSEVLGSTDWGTYMETPSLKGLGWRSGILGVRVWVLLTALISVLILFLVAMELRMFAFKGVGSCAVGVIRSWQLS